MIPDFTPEGLLPLAEHGLPHVCTRDEVHHRLVIERGSPDWRVRLFDGWDLVRSVVADFVPSATWWLWGCFVSSPKQPLFGEDETTSAVVMLPVDELPAGGPLIAVVNFLSSAEEQYGVDVRIVYEFDRGHHAYMDTMDALETRWRPQAALGVADHRTKELVPAGYLEVRP